MFVSYHMQPHTMKLVMFNIVGLDREQSDTRLMYQSTLKCVQTESINFGVCTFASCDCIFGIKSDELIVMYLQEKLARN